MKTDRSHGAMLLAHAAENPVDRPALGVIRPWIAPIAVITSLAVLVFAGIYTLDVYVLGDPGRAASPVAKYLDFDPGYLEDALPALGMTIVAVLGIVLTVVAIIVQLSSERYTGVALMFLKDGINIGVMVFYVFAGVCAIWLSVSLQDEFVPRAAMLMVMGFASVGLALMLPYFAYVFWFLEPGNIIDRIRFHATRLTNRGLAETSPGRVAVTQGKMLTLVEEITDIANNSIAGKDKIIASRAVDALRDFLIDYLAHKPEGDLAWYRPGEVIRRNPDFVSMDIELLEELEQQRNWVEWKTLRQMLGIYNEALPAMQDITYLIAIDTRYIGEAAAVREDDKLLEMVFRYMNSYLRSGINHRNVRTCYNVLNQYRMLVENLMRIGQGQAGLEGVAYMKYYGHISFDLKLPFVAETVAHDLATLCQFAHRKGHLIEEDNILRQFLDLDRPTHGYRQERGLRGVRKAQVKLGTYYLSVAEPEKAKMIADDMLSETIDFLDSIRDDLERNDSAYFWEIVDRGRNFEFLPLRQRAKLDELYELLRDAKPPRRRATDD